MHALICEGQAMLWDQSNRLIQLKTPLPDNALLGIALVGGEMLSHDFHFLLTVIATIKLSSKDQLKLIGQTLTVILFQNNVRHYLHAIIQTIAEVSHPAYKYPVFEIALQPLLSRLKSIAPKRYFKHQTHIAIIKNILQSHGVAYINDQQITRQYLQQDYVMQHNESDYDFMHRLLFEQDCFYYLLQTEAAEVFVFCDDCQQLPKSHQTLHSMDSSQSMIQRVYPAQFQGAQTVKCQTTVLGLSAGHVVQMAAHPNAVENTAYYIRRIQHWVKDYSYFNHDETETLFYRNECVLTELSNPFHLCAVGHDNTQRPMESALITTQSKSVLTDNKAQLKAQFHWDREGKFTADSSQWLRSRQWIVGDQWGVQIFPRQYQQVMVGYYDGLVSRPAVLGSVYNQLQVVPFAVDTQSGFRTQILEDQAVRGHQVIFDDHPKAEQQIWHVERQYDQCVLKDMKVTVSQQYMSTVGLEDSVKAKSLAMAANHSVVLMVGSSQLEMTADSIVVSAMKSELN